jgi:STE24 endopeptidase
MSHRRVYLWILLALVAVILLGPLPYWLSGVGQSAAALSAQVTHEANGVLVSSPKAEALHALALPMRIERLLLLPLLLLAFQFSGGALAMRRRLSLRSELLTVVVFIVVLDLGLALLNLPFEFYSGFVLDHQFGLSTQTAPAWAGDWALSLLITLVTDAILWTGFYALVRRLPRRWPIPAGAALLVLIGAFTLLTPVIITPLFYQVRPLDDPALRARILALADKAGMHVEAVDVIDASAKTNSVNAYFTGFGGAQRIVLYDTLLKGYTPDEVEVVLAHEMGHWYYHHMLLGLLAAGAAAWIGLFVLQRLLARTWRRLRLRGPADVAGLPYLLAVISILMILSLPAQNGLSRYAEAQADRFALTTSDKPGAFIQLFEKFAVQNLSVVDAPAWEKFVFYDHPSIAERIQMAREFERKP